MAVNERDPVSGYATTGHDWNGITELNAPVPRAVWIFIAVTHLYALIAWVLLPTWPLGQTYTKGLLGIDQRAEVAADIADADAARADWMSLMASAEFDAIRASPELMARAMATAAPLFGENCQPCHGKGGVGGPGFPRLSDNSWLWGETAEEIAETIRFGINNANPNARVAQMPAFGRDSLLTRPEIVLLADYVQTIAGGGQVDDGSEAAVLFQDNCASCHGEDARGTKGTGAPNLTVDTWIYGGDPATIHATLMNGRQGWMPAWSGRISEAEIRMLSLYVQSLSEGGP